MNTQPGELIRLLFGDGSTWKRRPIKRLLRWSDAFDAWLEERYTKFSPNVGPDSHKAWAEFLAFTRKAPWEVQVEQVEAYIKMLEGKGLSAGTIHKRLTGLKKFYEFCQERKIDRKCEPKFNPVIQARRPRVDRYEKANYLSLEEEEALLTVINNDSSVIGKRDYALFLLLLRTGCRAGEARNMRWGDVGEGAGVPRSGICGVDLGSWGEGEQGTFRPEASHGMQLRSGQGWGAPQWDLRGRLREPGRGGEDRKRVELPREVMKAILAYLEAAGRLESITTEDYVFAPSRAPLVRESGNKAEDWAAERPLSMDQLHYSVKLYAGWAGLEAESITCHTLRHTAVRRWIDAGMDAEEVKDKLGRVSSSKTREYTKMLQQIPLRTRKPTKKSHQTPSRGPGRFQLRNHLALKHGLRAKYLPELEWLEEQGIRLEGFDREAMRLKVVMRRALILSDSMETIEEGQQLLEAAGAAAGKFGRLLKRRHKLKEAAIKAEWDNAVDKAIEEELRENWPKHWRKYLEIMRRV